MSVTGGLTMTRFMLLVCGTALGVLTLGVQCPAQNKAGAKAWDFLHVWPDGRVMDPHRGYTTPDGKVYNRWMRQIGTYTENGDKVTMTVSPPRFPQYSGTYDLVKTGGPSPVWEGSLRNKPEVKWKLRMRPVQR
jgi:hypothetical protein